MKHLSYYIILLFPCLALLHSCRGGIDTSLLLQGHEYKLWHIADDGIDSPEWNNLDTVKLKSFWVQYNDVNEFINDTDRNSEHACYSKLIMGTGWMEGQWYKKKRRAPEFLYINRDGYVCHLVFNRETGDFDEMPDTELTGNWKLKNDTIMMINDKRYSVRRIENNPVAIQITDLKTGDKLKITDAGFLSGLTWTDINWTEENDRDYRKKWEHGIKQNPLLQGYDYKLWRKEKDFCGTYSFEDCGSVIISRDTTYITRYYYYCMFMYFDRYGRYANFYLSGDGWRIHESDCEEICCSDDLVPYHWRPESNDTIVFYSEKLKILCNNTDTLHLRNLKSGEDLRYIAVNLPPKSKKKKFEN